MAHCVTQSAFCLLKIVVVCLYFNNSVQSALKLECSDSFEQGDRGYTTISVFNKSTFSFLVTCQKNLSLSNVSVEMLCLFDDAKSNCQSRLRFSWTFESTVAQDLLRDVSVTLLQFSPIPGRWQDLNCHAVLYDYDDDDYDDEDDDDDDDDDDDYTQPSSLDFFVADFNCCDVDQGGHGYYAILKTTYDDLPSCRVGTPLTLIPARLTPKEDDLVTLAPGDEDLQTVTIVVATVSGQNPFSSVRAAIVISFAIVVCVVAAIVAYLCIRRRSHHKGRSFAERENSVQPFDLSNGSDVENFRDNNSYLHNCPHCVNETINRRIPDRDELFLECSGSDLEEEGQLDSGFVSGGPMFTPSDRTRTLAVHQ